MRIEIDIPKEFEEHSNQDKFKDSFERIMADLKNSLCAGNYEYETIEMLEKAFENSRKAYDIDKIISQLGDYGNEEIDYYRNTPYENCIRECVSKAIEIVKQGGDADDNCKWSQISTARYETSCGYKLVEFFDTNACYCKQCGKKIKIVGD